MKKLIVYKPSKVECDLSEWKSRKNLSEYYERIGANVFEIFEADAHQTKAREWMQKVFQCEMESIYQFGHRNFTVKDYDLIISLGGDNSFTKISHSCDSTPILGVNSDPERSRGHLLSASIRTEQDVHELELNLRKSDFRIEEWPRIECEINNDISTTLATSEIFVGEKLRKNMSRHILEHTYVNEEQKSSGLLVSTGAGYTGWYKSATSQIDDIGCFKPAQILYWAVTEPFEASVKNGYISNDSVMKVRSLNDDGIISIDSWEEYDFSRGATAEIKIGKSLKVVKFAL